MQFHARTSLLDAWPERLASTVRWVCASPTRLALVIAITMGIAVMLDRAVAAPDAADLALRDPHRELALLEAQLSLAIDDIYAEHPTRPHAALVDDIRRLQREIRALQPAPQVYVYRAPGVHQLVPVGVIGSR